MPARREVWCTAGGWYVSSTSPAGWDETTGRPVPGIRASVTRYPKTPAGRELRQRGEIDGRIYPTREAFEQACRERGYTAPYRARTWCTRCRALHTFLDKPHPTFRPSQCDSYARRSPAWGDEMRRAATAEHWRRNHIWRRTRTA